MTTCFSESDVQELGRTALEDFDRRLTRIPEDLCAPFHDEARQLETELMCLYRATVLCVRREESLERVAARWKEMVHLCDGFLAGIQRLSKKHPQCGAEIYHDQVLDLRNKCLRLEQMHQ
ncbi:MAG: hypothetical protein ACYDH9_10550 [Limisphaerales bacterium]